MAEDYYPFDSGIGANSAQSRWARMARLWSPSGVIGTPNTADYQLTFNGLTATVGYLAGDDSEAWVRGFIHRLHTSPWSQGVAANSAGNPLIERIVARRDLAAQTVTLMRLRGNPAVNPTPPPLLREEDGKWDLPLWQYRVPGGSGTVITNIIDERRWISPTGQPPVRSRFVTGTASGVLASGNSIDLCTPQVLPLAVFDAGVPFFLDIDARIKAIVAAGAGAKLELFVNGNLAGRDNVGNGAGGGATFTLKARDPAYRAMAQLDEQITVRAVLTAISGGLSEVADGRLFITAQPYVEL